MNAAIESCNGHITRPDGARIAYWIDGVADAPWLILSNSFATTHTMWKPQMPAFTARYRVLRYDTRGHGESEAPAGAYDFDMLAGDVVGLMDELDIAQAVMVGLSLGGMIGLTLALNAPERLSALVCCDARADAPEPYKAIWEGNLKRLAAEGLDALVEPTLGRWFTPAFMDAAANAAFLDEIRAMIRATSTDGYVGTARCLQSLDLLPRLGDLKVPTHYLVGAEDPAAPPQIMAGMANATPGAVLQELPGAAHLSNIEQSEAFTTAVLAFLNRDVVRRRTISAVANR